MAIRQNIENREYDPPETGLSARNKINENFIETFGRLTTVGNGGDYATLREAFNAGWRNFKLLSNITETFSTILDLNQPVLVNLNGFVLGTAWVSLNSKQSKIFNGTISALGSSIYEWFTNSLNTILELYILYKFLMTS